MNEPKQILPVGLESAAAFLLYLTAVATVVAVVAVIARVAGRGRARAPEIAAGFLAAWFAAALLVAGSTRDPQLGETTGRLLSAATALGPFVMGAGLLAFSRRWKSIVSAAAPDSLVAVQFYRVAGLMFLFPYLAYGSLPAGFAGPAGVGDFLTGAFAPFVARALARGGDGARRRAIAWNIFGILDLIVAPTMAVLTHARVLQMYPLAVVPLFLGPPLGILLHVHSLQNLAAARSLESTRPVGMEPAAAGRAVSIRAS